MVDTVDLMRANNDYHVLGSSFFDEKNLSRKTFLNPRQAVSMAKSILVSDVTQDIDNGCIVFRSYSDVLSHFADILLSLSLSVNGRNMKNLSNVYSNAVRLKKKDDKSEKDLDAE